MCSSHEHLSLQADVAGGHMQLAQQLHDGALQPRTMLQHNKLYLVVKADQLLFRESSGQVHNSSLTLLQHSQFRDFMDDTCSHE